MIVLKFGGSSVRDAEHINRVIDIAEGQIERSPLLVSSAMAKTTDALVALAREAELDHELAVRDKLEEVKATHFEAISRLVSGSARSELEEIVGRYFRELQSLATGVLLIKECSPRVLDAIMSFGELLSTNLIAARAKARGIRTRLLDSRKLLATNSEFTQAAVDFVQTNRAIQGSVKPEPGELVIAQGFIASDRSGVTTTLGRGGSDYTATIFGAALGAEEVQIWTDVTGIMTADPRIVAAALPVPSISYEEAAELAYFGAKVVHPSTIQPAVERGIPVIVRNTENPEHPGTRVSADAGGTGLRALTGKRSISLITVHSSRMLNAYGFLSRIFAVFAEHRVSVDLVATSEVSVSVSIDQQDDLTPVVSDLERYGRVTLESDKGLVSLVGHDLWKDSAFVARVFGVLQNVSIRMISLGSSDVNLSVIVQDADVERALELLHEEFFPPAGE